MPAHGSSSAGPTPARRLPRPRRSRLLTAMVSGGVVLAGCAAGPMGSLRVEPTLNVVHAQGAQVARGYVALARQYEGERRLPQALEAWRKASAAAPYDAAILDSLGIAEAGQGHLERAVELLRLAVALAPGQARLHNNLGHALQLAGHADEAIEQFRQALALDPAQAMAQRNLARVQARGAGLADTAARAEPRPVMAQPTPTAAPPVAEATVAAPAQGAPGGDHPIPDEGRAPTLQTAPNLPLLSVGQDAPDSVAPPLVKPPAVVTALEVETPNAEAPGIQAPATRQLVDRLPAAAAGRPVEDGAVRNASSAGDEPPTEPQAETAKAGSTASNDTAARADLRVEVANGNGVQGMAAWVRGLLRERGLADHVRLSNMDSFENRATVVQYRPGHEADARVIARGLPHPAVVAAAPTLLAGADVRVLLGKDMSAAVPCDDRCPDYAPPPLAQESGPMQVPAGPLREDVAQPAPVPAGPAVRPQALAASGGAEATALAPPRADLQVEVSNGNGVEGMAAWVGGLLRARGLAGRVRLSNMADFQNQLTVVQYRQGYAAEARTVAHALPQPAIVAAAPTRLPRGDLRVLLGKDMRTAVRCEPSCPDYADVPPGYAVAAAGPGH